MSSPQRQYCSETAPTRIEKLPWLERIAGIFLKLFVLTAPVGAGFASGLDLLAVYSPEASAAVSSMFADLLQLLNSLVFLVWVAAVAVWLGSHLLRPHNPLRLEDMPFALTAPSFVLYLIALGQGLGG